MESKILDRILDLIGNRDLIKKLVEKRTAFYQRNGLRTYDFLL